ncbi:MAG: amidase, partial [Saprospiraceae bacterium]|nr:amidase [Saprospiraceae bacterium]
MNKRISLSALIIMALTALLSGFFFSDALNSDDVRAAAKIMALSFSDEEITMMLPDLEEARRLYRTTRHLNVANELAPALVFNPIIPGIVIPSENGTSRYNFPKKGIRLDSRDNLAWMSIPELASLLRTQEITSVALTRFFIDRLKKYNDTLQCVITLTEERAMAAAQKADEELAKGIDRGLLHGIPYGSKDLLSVK